MKNAWDELKNIINFSYMATVVDENGEVDMEIRQNRTELFILTVKVSVQIYKYIHTQNAYASSYRTYNVMQPK